MDGFKEGFLFAEKQLPSVLGSMTADHYLSTISAEIDAMMEKLYEESERRANLDVEHLQGYDAEVWHTYTQRINAIVRGKSIDTQMPESVKLASADIVSGNQAYSSKYYGTAGGSVRAQATTIEGHYMMLKKAAEKRGDEFLSLEDYMEQYFPDARNPSQSIYYAQGRLVPADQIEEARAILRRKVLKETANGRMEVVENLQEVLDSLTTTVDDGRGNCSLQLTREQAGLLARASKNGDLDIVFEKLGITIKDLIKPEDIMREAFKSGMSAAVLSFVIHVTPVILNAISYLLQSEKIDAEKLKKEGFGILDQTTKSFMLGAISAGVTIAAKSGYFGMALETASPTIIGTVVALAYECIEKSFKLAVGGITKQEYAQEMMRDGFVAVCSVASGAALQILLSQIPVAAYLIGSAVGSVVGSLLYSVAERVLLSYCIESGCTFFGLVDQNYELSNEILQEMGLIVFEMEELQVSCFEYDAFMVEQLEYAAFQYERFGMKILKRGIIEVFSVGYI